MPPDAASELLLDRPGLAEAIERLGLGLARFVEDPARAAIIGIRTRGATLAKRIERLLTERKGWRLPLGVLDITFYRDDLDQLGPHPVARPTDLDFDVEDRTIVLVDDVLYTGRTIRSALDLIVDFGRPRSVRLGVLVDRGHRELPIQPDLTAIKLQVEPGRIVQVCLEEDDGREGVWLIDRRHD